MHYSVYLFTVYLCIHICCKDADVHATCVSEVYMALPCFLKTTLGKYPTWRFEKQIYPPRFASKPLLLSLKNEALDISCNITTNGAYSITSRVERNEEELKVNSVKNGFRVVYIPIEELIFRGHYDAYGAVRNIDFLAVNRTFTVRFQHPRHILTYENVKLSNNSQFIDLSLAPVTYHSVPRYSGPAFFYDIQLANETEDTEAMNIINQALHRLLYRYIFLEHVNGTSYDVTLMNRYLQEVFQTTPVTKILECWECRTGPTAHHDATNMEHSGNMQLSYSLSFLVVFVGMFNLLIVYYNF